VHGPWPNPRQSEEGWKQSNLAPRKVRPFFGLYLVILGKSKLTTLTLNKSLQTRLRVSSHGVPGQGEAGLNRSLAFSDQAAGDLGFVLVDGLEAGHDDLEQREPDSALLADGDHALVVDEHEHEHVQKGRAY
jgi:hypothetical protein